LAKVKNLTEHGINEVVILGKTILKISGIENEQLKAYYEGKITNSLTFLKILETIGTRFKILKLMTLKRNFN